MVKEAGPTFIKKPSLNQSDDGRILTFSCQIAGEPRPNFKWILGDKEIKTGGRYRSDVKKAGSGYQVRRIFSIHYMACYLKYSYILYK